MRRGSRAGFTLIEVVIAVTILGIVALGLMSATARLTRGVTDDRVRTAAAASADAQIALVRSWPVYATLDATYAGTLSNTPLPGLSRATTVVRTGGVGQTNDYKRVTVQVSGTGLATPIRRTVTVAAF
ncbi:MAG: prepilin-type N-terminal cleavage/methylation domain-containing protein [Gemmatimonadota bacterium]|nr:prepilin-type N-terminal cleavage/methylation domain-containing protein [Gemmatimonadota bacterium]